MIKIISLFQRNYDTDHLVRDEVVLGAEWVLNGEGRATEKMDGTSCMIKDGKLYKRYDAKNKKHPITGFIPAQEPDPITGHWPGWVPIQDSKPEDRWHREGFLNMLAQSDGTYELIGPKVNGNKHGLEYHILVWHGHRTIEAPRTFNELKEWFKDQNIEGIVWHHPDGRMVKIKKKDFGHKW